MDRTKKLARLMMPAILASACSSTTAVEPRPEIDMAVIRAYLNCPPGTTPTCSQHTGQKTQCFCADEDALKQIMNPEARP
jgi:hypothetical protein